MKTKSKVVLLGNSVFVVGLQASLQSQASVDVIRLDIASAWEYMQSECPDVVIFDLASLPPPALFELSLHYRNINLIGLDLNQDEIILLSSRRQPILAANELVEVIRQLIHLNPEVS